MPKESKLTPDVMDAMLRQAVESGNRLEVDEPPLVIPPEESPSPQTPDSP